MTHQHYLQRAAHILATVAIAFGILAAAPVAEAFRTTGVRAPQAAPHSAFASPPAGDLVARIAVPRLHVDAPVYEGIALEDLARGAGHLPGTAIPGEEGANASATKPCVLAVARDSAAAGVVDANVGDTVVLRTAFGVQTYRVVRKRVLELEAVDLDSKRPSFVTVVAPYPADSVGPAPQRLALLLERRS